MTSKRYPDLIPGTKEYQHAAVKVYREKLRMRLGVDEIRRRERERVRRYRARDRRPLDAEMMQRMDQAVRRRA